jgi:hypothetical protein
VGPPYNRPILSALESQPQPAQPAAHDPDLESRLTWIWGSPRSGSTWLLKLISHPLDPDPEAALGFRVPEGGLPGPVDSIPVDETFISNHLSPALADPRVVDGRWMAGTINNLMAEKPAYVFSDEYREFWHPAAREFALARLGAVLTRSRQAGIELAPDYRMVIKETNGSHAADLLMGVLPGSRLLLLIRDGRDVVDSLLAAYQPKAFMANKLRYSFGSPDERAQGLLWAARLWASNTDITLKAIDSHPPELTRIVRYEDLLADTAGELAALYEWLDLERDPRRIQRIVEACSFDKLPPKQRGPLTRNRAATPGLWRKNLSRKEQRRVAEICNPLLERFGYEL